MKKDKIAGLFSIVFVVFLLCLAVNAWYQAQAYRETLENKAVIAAFIKKDSTASLDVIKERIINTDNVRGADLVTSEMAMKNAIESTPSLGEILISKENPFSPYYMKRANKVNKTGFEELKETLSKLEGVDAVVYDKNGIDIHDTLDVFCGYYELCLKSAGILAGILLLIKLVLKFTEEEPEPMTLVYSAVAGLFSGVVGIGVYTYAAHRYMQSDIINLPSSYFGYIVLSGLLVSLLWD